MDAGVNVMDMSNASWFQKPHGDHPGRSPHGRDDGSGDVREGRGRANVWELRNMEILG